MIDALDGISNPLIQSGGAGAVALSLLAMKRWRTGIVLLLAAAIWAWLCATPAFALVLRNGLAHQYPPHAPSWYPQAEAIVVVGGSPAPPNASEWNAAQRPELTNPLGFAVALYRVHKASILVATGSYGTPRMKRVLIRQGIPQGALRLEPASETTHQDAQYTLHALQQSHARTILLVATNRHMPRTAATFRAADFNVIAAPTLMPSWVNHWPRRSLVPHEAAISLSKSCLHEYIGLLYYRLRGWATWKH